MKVCLTWFLFRISFKRGRKSPGRAGSTTTSFPSSAARVGKCSVSRTIALWSLQLERLELERQQARDHVGKALRVRHEDRDDLRVFFRANADYDALAPGRAPVVEVDERAREL